MPDDGQTEPASKPPVTIDNDTVEQKTGENPADSATDAIEVTGSRLSNGDPTSHVIVIDRKQIERSGVTSVEDLIRTLPQNVATVGAITNSRSRGPLTDRRAPISGIGSLGVSAANLGGIGAGNTLILVNGRRLAGAAGIEDGFVNLNGIPLAAIDRVEISQNGASAVYGADAMGGVINFILRKNFTGVTLTGQYENSNNGADRLRTSAYIGKSWRTGNISVTLDYTKSDPIANAKTGYVTENYSSIFGGDPNFDFRNFSRGLQPGIIDTSSFDFDPVSGNYVNNVRGLTPRPGVTGRPAISDFVEIGKDAARDYIAEFAGPTSKSFSGTVNFEQSITDKLKIFGNGLFNRTSNSQLQDLNTGLRMTLAPGQAYNPFPAFTFNSFSPGTDVNYFPAAEIADGTLVAGRLRNVSTSWSANVGVNYDFNKDTRFSLIYTTSRSTTSGSGSTLSSFVSIQEDPSSPSGASCYDFILANNRLTGAARDSRQAAYEKQCRALTSTDPNVAFNPFRSGAAAAGGGSIQDFVYEDTLEDLGSRLQLIEARLNGSLLTLPAGKVMYSVGGEYSTDGVKSDAINLLTGSSQSRNRYAGFGEINVPIFGGQFTLPLINSLLINVAGRRDSYETTGAVGTVNNVPIDLGGALLFRRSTFSRFTPAWGFQWRPIRAISVLGRWTTGFKAPPYTQLFNPAGTTRARTGITNDPLYRCTTDCSSQFGDTYVYTVPSVVAPNPDLRPQTSRQQTFSVQLNPQGSWDRLSFVVTYNHTRLKNEYAGPRDLQDLLTNAQIVGIPLFYPRDANGKVTEYRNLTYNIVGSDYKSITYELNYNLETSIGRFEPALIVVQNIHATRQALPDSPVVDTVGTIGGPDRYRINGRVTFVRGNVAATLLGYYTPSYVNDYFAGRSAGIITNPEKLLRVRAYTTFDLTATWQATTRARLTFAGRNIFDATPPFTVVDSRPYDTARYNVAGRTLSLQAAYSF